MLQRLLASIALLLIFVPPSSATELLTDRGLYDYAGDMNGTTLIGLTLRQRDGQKISGSYFYKRYLKDIPLTGEFTGERDLVLRESDATGQLAATFTLHFEERDPRHTRGDNAPLTVDVLTGTWTSADKSKTLPVYLALAQIATGAKDGRRYEVAGANDDALIERNAQAFYRAVETGDRQTVAGYLSYPITYSVAGKRTKAASAAEFLKDYERVFTPPFVARIRAAVPHDMFANAQGIMLADGAVWFNDKGKVFALNN